MDVPHLAEVQEPPGGGVAVERVEHAGVICLERVHGLGGGKAPEIRNFLYLTFLLCVLSMKCYLLVMALYPLQKNFLENADFFKRWCPRIQDMKLLSRM